MKQPITPEAQANAHIEHFCEAAVPKTGVYFALTAAAKRLTNQFHISTNVHEPRILASMLREVSGRNPNTDYRGRGEGAKETKPELK